MVAINYNGWPTIELPHFYPELVNVYTDAEPQTKEWFIRHIKRDWVILDCGANIGVYTILFSQLASMGEVHAFEPTSTMKMLRQNISFHRCDNVWLYDFALGSKAGILKDKIFRIWGLPPDEAEFKFVTIDSWRNYYGGQMDRIDCIKIDVDSFDYEVLLGAVETLELFNPWIVIELNDALKLRGWSQEQALEWLRSQGYHSYRILDSENFVMKRGINANAR